MVQRLELAARESMDRDVDVVLSFNLCEAGIQSVRQGLELLGTRDYVQAEGVHASNTRCRFVDPRRDRVVRKTRNQVAQRDCERLESMRLGTKELPEDS